MNHNFLLNTGIHESTHNQIIKKNLSLLQRVLLQKLFPKASFTTKIDFCLLLFLINQSVRGNIAQIKKFTSNPDHLGTYLIGSYK